MFFFTCSMSPSRFNVFIDVERCPSRILSTTHPSVDSSNILTRHFDFFIRFVGKPPPTFPTFPTPPLAKFLPMLLMPPTDKHLESRSRFFLLGLCRSLLGNAAAADVAVGCVVGFLTSFTGVRSDLTSFFGIASDLIFLLLRLTVTALPSVLLDIVLSASTVVIFSVLSVVGHFLLSLELFCMISE